MKMDLSKVSYDGKWINHGEAELKVRPYPASRTNLVYRDGNVMAAGEDGCDMFIYCLEDWKGVVDAQGQPIKLTDEVKKQIFDFQLGQVAAPDGSMVSMSNRVLTAARKMTADIEADVKN